MGDSRMLFQRNENKFGMRRESLLTKCKVKKPAIRSRIYLAFEEMSVLRDSGYHVSGFFSC